MLVAQLCPTLCDSMDYSLPGSSAHGILQARILEWVAVSPSRGISTARRSNPRCLHCRLLVYHWPRGKLLYSLTGHLQKKYANAHSKMMHRSICVLDLGVLRVSISALTIFLQAWLSACLPDLVWSYLRAAVQGCGMLLVSPHLSSLWLKMAPGRNWYNIKSGP